jgi:hypothetical protein
MFIILAAIVDFGMSLDHRITLQHAVREGSRYAAVHTGATACADIQQRVADSSGGIIQASQVSVRYVHENGGAANPATTDDSVCVSAPFDWTFPLVGGPIHLGSLTIGVGPIHSHTSAPSRLEMTVVNPVNCGPSSPAIGKGGCGP